MSQLAQRSGGLGDTLQLLRDGRPRTRAELAQVTGQSRSTVAGRVDELLALGLVSPTGEASSTGGRPPATFAFNPASRTVVAIDLGATHARVAVTDLACTVLVEHLETISIADGPEVVLDRVAAIARRLLAETPDASGRLVGVGVGLPGPVDHTTGRPVNPPIMPGWDGYDVAGGLAALLDCAVVLVDNDVNLMALGEHSARYRDVDHLLFVKVATGVGAGVISDGAIRRGAQGAAGDLGHIAVPGCEDVVCRCGNLGCLEAVAGGGAIAAQLSGGEEQVSSVDDVVALVRSGDAAASRAVREAGRSLGKVLAACVSMLNPSVIVVGGSLAALGDQLLAGIREVVYCRSLPLATQHLRIVTSQTTGRAGILGASAMVIDHVFSSDVLEGLA